MIITRTPMRISLFGGGTDMPEFYQQAGYGAVVNFAINKYIYVSLNDKFDGKIRVSYSKQETVDTPDELQHEIVKQALNHWGLKGLEITSVSDIPGEGSGLGSSSSFTVGLCHGLIRYIDRQSNFHPFILAEVAHVIEREECGYPVGKQDHFAAAYGGLHFYTFHQDGRAVAELMRYSMETKYFLENHLMLFWTGRSRNGNPLLDEQGRRFLSKESMTAGLVLRSLAREAHDLLAKGNAEALGELFNEAWEAKKRLTTVSDAWIDEIYDRAILAGAEGGKICGAGGGGFLLLVANPRVQMDVEEAVGLRRVRFEIENRGSQVIYKGD